MGGRYYRKLISMNTPCKKKLKNKLQTDKRRKSAFSWSQYNESELNSLNHCCYTLPHANTHGCQAKLLVFFLKLIN